MSPSPAAPTPMVRPLAAADLEAVVDLDRRTVGRSRRGFYEKRLAGLAREPAAFIALALDHAEGGLAGFVFARLLHGEFGGTEPVAVLDALGVDPDQRHQGTGRRLMAGLEAEMRRRDVREMSTEALWTEPDLLRFFAAAGFHLAPRLVVERTTEQQHTLL